MTYLLFLILLFLGMIVYTRIANRFLIFDTPNLRSSHSKPTIRGGGIVFLFSLLLACIQYHPEYWLPFSGAVAIGIISFLDDNITLSTGIRLIVHFFSITLLFFYLPVFADFPIWAIIALYVLVTGIINAYNFMDGINGITGLYSLIVLGGLQYVNLYQVPFTEPDLIWLPMLACLVFLYYNFRVKAKVFAGDVGSITVAFWLVFLILDLSITSSNPVYILFLAVYGVDTVLTIIHRLKLRQNILEAHRLHFYQILANDQKIPHLWVSSIYGLVQALIIVFAITSKLSFIATTLISILPLAVVYIALKPRFMNSPASATNEKFIPSGKQKTVPVNRM